MPISLTIIVARAKNGVIGHGNQLPWRIPEELQHFKVTTLGHAVIMGRKTFESIGKPLPGRRIIVVSRNANWQHPGCEVVSSIEQAQRCCEYPHALMTHHEQAFIAGGEQLYRAALPLVDRLLITEIDLAPEGDAFFDDPDPAQWALASRDERRSQNGQHFAISEWVRKPGL